MKNKEKYDHLYLFIYIILFLGMLKNTGYTRLIQPENILGKGHRVCNPFRTTYFLPEPNRPNPFVTSIFLERQT